MKVYDCITFSNERLLYNLRLNILDKFVDKFIVIEANYTHSGNPKKINFNINHYPKFKKKLYTSFLQKNLMNLNFQIRILKDGIVIKEWNFKEIILLMR